MSEITNDIINSFDYRGKVVSCVEFGSGHINRTYLLSTADDEQEYKYIPVSYTHLTLPTT